MSQDRFDKAALTWDDMPSRRELAAAVVAVIKEKIPLMFQANTLEVGCGTGLLTCEFADVLPKIVAIDTSTEMLAILQGKIGALGLDNVEAQQFDLTTGDMLGFSDFNFIYSAMTLHHIKDTGAFLAACHKHLKPGGTIALADLEKEDGSFHDDMEGVEHKGFDSKDLADLAAASGFDDVKFVTAHRVSKEQDDGTVNEYPVFLMIATAR